MLNSGLVNVAFKFGLFSVADFSVISTMFLDSVL